MKISSVKYIAIIFFMLQSSGFASPPTADFSSPGHLSMGDEINLHLTLAKDNKPVELHLSDNLSMTYGEILAMPDFFALEQPISSSSNESERKQIFLGSFNTLIQSQSIDEAKNIIQLIHEEKDRVLAGIQQGKSPEKIYQEIGHEFDRKYNCATGGGCSEKTWWLYPGRYLDLLEVNIDHFNDHAMIAYQTGHQLALEKAVLAHQTGDLQTLEMAYALNAYACHFLSDRFATGHIRTPRVELPDHTTPSVIGTLLSGFMHDEESSAGLHVHNARKDQWIAYGDKLWFDHKIDTHKAILLEALQSSADAIFAAYSQGTVEVNDEVENLLPQPDETLNNSNLDIAPLFYWDANSQKLMRREDINNLYDRHWTDDWWAWSTLIELDERYGMTETSKAMLSKAGLLQEAEKRGLR